MTDAPPNRPPLPDRRLHAYRDDLASEDLRGVIDAPKFVKGTLRQLVVPSTPLKREPRFDTPIDTEVLFGEQVMQFEVHEGWAWVQCIRDGYVGYIAVDSLKDAPTEAGATTEVPVKSVSAPSTFIYPGPDMKLPPLSQLPMNAQIKAVGTKGEFTATTPSGFVITKHLRDEKTPETNFVDIALDFVGTPYLWGGRTYGGIDCSGLVQTAMIASGQTVLRDTDMQENSIGEAIKHDAGVAQLIKGDLIFWAGHVGIMIDKEHLLHANAYHMQTVVEPYEEARLRIAAGDTGAVRTIRRPD